MCFSTSPVNIRATLVKPPLVLLIMSKEETKKKVQFKDKTYVVDILSHHNYSNTERNSAWYNNKEYRAFQLDEKRELLSGPPFERKEKSRRTQQIDSVRSLVLEAQSFQRKQQVEITSILASHDNCNKWLAEYYKHHSESCATAARQRGLENDLELININRVREASSMLLKHSALFKKLTVSKGTTNYTSANNNASWSPVIDRDKQNSSLSSLSNKLINNNDTSPNTVKSSRMLRLELCKDFDLKSKSMVNPTSTIKSIDSFSPNKHRQDQRWSASNPSKNSRRKVSKRDTLLKPLKHSSSMMDM
jgi:hypothetical protein